MSSFAVRPATVADAEACRQIYRPYVEETALTFETELPTLDDFTARIATAINTHAWLVLEREGDIVGYASSRPFDARAAYRWSCETGLYLAAGSHGNGGGRLLYEALLDAVAARGYRVAIGRIVDPNPASVRLHERLGFTTVGTLRSIGWKLNAWHDVILMQKYLSTPASPPAPLR